MVLTTSNVPSGILTDVTNTLIDDCLQAGRAVRLTITTGSMMPMLRPGDQVIVCVARPEELRRGDIVLMQLGDSRVVHRLIGWRSVDGVQHLITKGDDARVADAICAPGNLCGIIMVIERNSHRMNLRTRGARALSHLLALLSRAESEIYRAQPGLFRRVALKGLRVSLRVGVLGLGWTSKETTA